MNAMFKKGVLASVLAVAASSAMAASSVDIQVTGKIVPSSCTPAFISGGGIADFGTMKVASLNSTTPTPLADVKIIPISITCEEATRVGVTFNDSHVDSAPTETIPVNFLIRISLPAWVLRLAWGCMAIRRLALIQWVSKRPTGRRPTETV